MTWSNHTQKIFTIIIYDNKYRGTILDYPFVILSHIAKVSSLVRYDSGMVCLPQQSPILLLIYNVFKTRLNSGTKASPKYFHIGDRKENIVSCQMRNDVSNLYIHLQQHHLSDIPSCPHCNDPCESPSHYCMHCPLYNIHRQQLVDSFNELSI